MSEETPPRLRRNIPNMLNGLVAEATRYNEFGDDPVAELDLSAVNYVGEERVKLETSAQLNDKGSGHVLEVEQRMQGVVHSITVSGDKVIERTVTSKASGVEEEVVSYTFATRQLLINSEPSRNTDVTKQVVQRAGEAIMTARKLLNESLKEENS